MLHFFTPSSHTNRATCYVCTVTALWRLKKHSEGSSQATRCMPGTTPTAPHGSRHESSGLQAPTPMRSLQITARSCNGTSTSCSNTCFQKPWSTGRPTRPSTTWNYCLHCCHRTLPPRTGGPANRRLARPLGFDSPSTSLCGLSGHSSSNSSPHHRGGSPGCDI